MIAMAACLLATARAVPAQPLVRIVGAVQWVSSTSMAMMSDHGDSMMIDLMEADQSTYRGFEPEIGSSSTVRWRLTGGT
jgi:hypothetical protein